MGGVVFSFFFLFDRSDYFLGSMVSVDDVFVGDGEKVVFFDSEVVVFGSDDFYVFNYFCELRISIMVVWNVFLRYYEFIFVVFGLFG